MCNIYRGGIKLFFNGTNLNAAQHPLLEVNDQDYLDIINVGQLLQGQECPYEHHKNIILQTNCN